MPYSLRRFSFKAMGSPCELQFYDDSRVQARKRARELIQESERLERKYSRYLEDSFLSQINRSAGASAGITLDEETRKLLTMQQPAITSVTVCSTSPQAYCEMCGISAYLSYQTRHDCPPCLLLSVLTNYAGSTRRFTWLPVWKLISAAS